MLLLWQGTDDHVAVIALCNATKTYLFKVRQPGLLPMALHLFLTHPGFYKIGYETREHIIGKMFVEFGVVLDVLFDVADQFEREYGTRDMVAVYPRISSSQRAPIDPAQANSRWTSEPLDPKQQQYAAFFPVVAREAWHQLARPEGPFPPVLHDSYPVDATQVLQVVERKRRRRRRRRRRKKKASKEE